MSVLAPDDRIMLVHFSPPHALAGWWATPGGALDAGETHEEGLRRELLEEAGISAPIALPRSTIRLAGCRSA